MASSADHAKANDNDELQRQILLLQAQVTSLRNQQLQNFETADELDEFLTSRVKSRVAVPRSEARLRT